MTADTTTPYRSTAAAGRDGFAQLLHSEWTKFRTVRGWVIATAFAALLMIAFGILIGLGNHSSVATPDHPEGIVGHPYVPIGPDGEAVTDEFYLLHQPLAGDGSITARVSSLAGATLPGLQPGMGVPAPATGAPGAWAKAGLIVKQNTNQGSAYAAVMATGGHGVRMQYDYTGDIAGPAGAVSAGSPRWLRLARAGDTVTGYASSDGATWTAIGTVHLAKLSGAVQVGMFVASPASSVFDQHLGGGTGMKRNTIATAVFDGVTLQGSGSAGTWTTTSVGASADRPDLGALQQSGSGYMVTGSGDIAPGNDAGGPFDRILVGAFAVLVVLVVLGVLVISTEYRRGLIRTSLTTSPRRGRVLAAKAVVLGAVAFVAGLVGAVLTAPIGEHFLRANGNFISPVTTLTTARVIVGTAALLAVAAVLALAIGTILRRSAAAVAAAIVLVVLPYILGTAGVLPAGPSQWLLRITPAAAFAVQQSIPAYPQVEGHYDPLHGYFPLAPWAGFAVLCAWAVLALGAAAYAVRTRDV